MEDLTRYVILTDSACDLSPGMRSQAEFSAVPMTYLQGSESYPGEDAARRAPFTAVPGIP